MEGDVGSLEIGTPVAYTLDLTSHQYDPSLELFDDFIVEECFFVLDDDLVDYGSHGADYMGNLLKVYFLIKKY